MLKDGEFYVNDTGEVIRRDGNPKSEDIGVDIYKDTDTATDYSQLMKQMDEDCLSPDTIEDIVSFKECSEKELLFCKYYAHGVKGAKPFNALQAAKEAGYAFPQVNAYKVLKRPHVIKQIELLVDDVQDLFIRKALGAIETLEEISRKGTDERARVQAANSILDRAGYKAVDRVVIGDASTMDRDELGKRFVEILFSVTGAGDEVKKLLGDKASREDIIGQAVEIIGEQENGNETPL